MHSEELRRVLRRLSPGTGLREGLERILRGHTGALIVLGCDSTVRSLCTGGFEMEVLFSPTRLRELAKMDGAIVLSEDGKHILAAAVHLMPDASIETEESGTRHRTAERVSRQTQYPVLAVSQSMSTIGLYFDSPRYLLLDSATVLARGNQALATLERYKHRLDEVSQHLSALEIEDAVTLRDVVTVLQRLEMVRHIADEVSGYVIELGVEGRLLALQLEELMSGVDTHRLMLVRDYLPHEAEHAVLSSVLDTIDGLDDTALLDPTEVARALGYTGSSDTVEMRVSAHGYRLLSSVPRLPGAVIERLTQHFNGLQALLGASVEDLQAVEGVGATRAHSVRESLTRLAESSILERYV